MRGRTIVVVTMTRVDSVPRVLEQLFMTVLRPKMATVPVITMENTVSHVVVIVLVRARKVVISPVREVISLARVVTSLARVRAVTKVVISLVRAATSLVRARVVISVRRVVISLAKDRVATSLVRVVTNRTRNLMANLVVLIRKAPVSILPTMIRMLSTA